MKKESYIVLKVIMAIALIEGKVADFDRRFECDEIIFMEGFMRNQHYHKTFFKRKIYTREDLKTVIKQFNSLEKSSILFQDLVKKNKKIIMAYLHATSSNSYGRDKFKRKLRTLESLKENSIKELFISTNEFYDVYINGDKNKI